MLSSRQDGRSGDEVEGQDRCSWSLKSSVGLEGEGRLQDQTSGQGSHCGGHHVETVSNSLPPLDKRFSCDAYR